MSVRHHGFLYVFSYLCHFGAEKVHETSYDESLPSLECNYRPSLLIILLFLYYYVKDSSLKTQALTLGHSYTECEQQQCAAKVEGKVRRSALTMNWLE